jgi:hypothetical protein
VNDFDDDLTEIDETETETEKCKNISSVPICGEGQEINFDPFGRPICVCRNYHFFILEIENNIYNNSNNKNDSNDNNNKNNNKIDTKNNINNNERKTNNNNNNNEIDTNNGALDVHDQISIGNILGKFPDQVNENCYIPGSQGENIFVF